MDKLAVAGLIYILAVVVWHAYFVDEVKKPPKPPPPREKGLVGAKFKKGEVEELEDGRKNV